LKWNIWQDFRKSRKTYANKVSTAFTYLNNVYTKLLVDFENYSENVFRRKNKILLNVNFDSCLIFQTILATIILYYNIIITIRHINQMYRYSLCLIFGLYLYIIININFYNFIELHTNYN